MSEQLVEIIAEENAKVGWKEYADHIRKGNRDLAARVSLAIAERAYELGRTDQRQYENEITGV